MFAGAENLHTHTDQYLLFDSHHPLEHKLGVIKTLQHRAKEVPTSIQGKKKEQENLKTALETCRLGLDKKNLQEARPQQRRGESIY